MRILVPLNNAVNIEGFVKAGASEFYIGFYDEQWTETFGEYSDINRMSGFKAHANQYDFEQMLDAIKKIKDFGQRAFVTLNANVYTKDQIDFIATNYFPSLKAANTDGVIVSTVEMGRAARTSGIEPVGSTMLGVYNRDIAAYYFKQGIRRIILPRDLSLDEIAGIISSLPDADFEVFLLRNGCVFSDGFCLGTHRIKCGSTCGYLRESQTTVITNFKGFEDQHAMRLNSRVYKTLFHKDACGLCALYRFKEMGVTSLKIVGRADNAVSVCDDILLTKANLELLEKCSSEEEYLRRMKFPKNANTQCLLGLSCYYPEVRFK